MEEACAILDVIRNSEGPSLSELDQGFLTDSNLSALSNERTVKPPKGIVVQYSEPGLIPPHSGYHSSVLSPSNTQSKMTLLSPNITMTATGIHSPVDGKSSTPYARMTFQKPVLASMLDLSCIDLTMSHPLWEVSFIRPSVESPKPGLDLNKMESTWSPSFQYGPPTLAEISSLILSGTPPAEGQKCCWEVTFQDSNLRHAVLEPTNDQQKSVS